MHRQVKKTVIVLLPVLASFSPSEFVHNYLNTSMMHLFNTLKRERAEERSAVFIALGEIAKVRQCNKSFM
jgi:FKBP12-rapamycin complex-associated protein